MTVTADLKPDVFILGATIPLIPFPKRKGKEKIFTTSPSNSPFAFQAEGGEPEKTAAHPNLPSRGEGGVLEESEE